MSPAPPLPDLSKLTDAQKNELIVSLWQTLVATDENDSAPAAPAGTKDSGISADVLRERIRRVAPPTRAPTRLGVRPRLGAGLGLLESKLLMGVLLVIGAAFLVDFGIGWYQQRTLDAQHRAALALRNAAFGGLFVELVRVSYEPDGESYRATVTMQNSSAGQPLYIMLNPLRVFVQVNLTWQEVPARAPDGSQWGVVKLGGAGEYSVVFRVNARNWAELMPGYMHVRIESNMLVSRRSDPGSDDIIERNNRFYVYLKPQGADDSAIKRRSNFPGVPPVFIPMPPH
jgi:hypothetical protein